MKETQRLLWQGFQMAAAFLSIFPAKNAVWDTKTARYAVFFFPICGALIGLVTWAAYIVLESLYLPAYILAFFIVLLSVVLHGGLHLDGWMDVSDAAFSWRDKEQKLEIMKDSRTGAAAVWTTIFLLAGRLLFVMYVLETDVLPIWFVLLTAPVLARTAMGHLLISAPLAKKDGLAAWFRADSKQYDAWMLLLISSCWLLFLFLLAPSYIGAGMFIGMIVAAVYWLGRYLFIKWFGGINGDMAGALCEGVETVIWFTSVLYISYVMA
ncbi:adenosylcobinamide-GDP ribazoletransferase [Alteribacillus persepolensis]|nr:adenosylcobinamide-GDP ribazoletransferase [Alteribacillus persepolensis]